MPDQPLSPTTPLEPHHQITVAGVNWAGVFEFTHLFRGFRLASNPAKLMVALAALILMYVGGRAFDVAWGPQVMPGEIELYQAKAPLSPAQRQNQRHEELRAALRTAAMFSPSGLSDVDIERLSEQPRAAYAALKRMHLQRFSDAVSLAQRERVQEEQMMAQTPATFWGPRTITPAESERRAKEAAALRLQESMEVARRAAGQGVFAAFLGYEMRQFDALIDNTLSFVRIAPVRTDDARTGGPSDLDLSRQIAVSGGLASRSAERFWRSDTIVGCVANITLTGPGWLVTAAGPMGWRPVNADTWKGWLGMVALRALYLVSLAGLAALWLAATAMAGAVICRMAALEFAGVEQAGLAAAVRFARGKLVEFLKAPLLPFAIVLVIGLAMAGVGLIGAVPWIGEVLVGAGFFIFLAGGFLVMLLVLAIVGGYHLLYPTMAVEGSDSFDAMSRSFAYVFARPWRLVCYTLVSLVYGVITYLFAALVVYLVLGATHLFTGWGMDLGGYREGAYSGLSKLDTIWPWPTPFHLIAPTNWWAMSWSEWVAAVFVHSWVYLLVAGLGAYVMSYYFSSNTILYYLLRRSVDGQSLNEVWEEGEIEQKAEVSSVKSEVG